MTKKPHPSEQAHEMLGTGRHSEHAHEVLLKEFEYLRRELELWINAHQSLERNVVIAIGVSWAWLFTQRASVPAMAWLLPCLFAVLGVHRAINIGGFSRVFHEYVSKVEEFYLGKPGGWEHTTEDRIWNLTSGFVFWLLLIGSTAVVAWYEIRVDPHKPTASTNCSTSSNQQSPPGSQAAPSSGAPSPAPPGKPPH